VIRLVDLLVEKTAAEEAKEKGLKHIGWGRWANPNDPKTVVAKTVRGRLKWLEKPKKAGEPEEEKPDQLELPGFEATGEPQVVVRGKTQPDDLNDEFGIFTKELVRGEQTTIYALGGADKYAPPVDPRTEPKGYEAQQKLKELIGRFAQLEDKTLYRLNIECEKYTVKDASKQAMEWRTGLTPWQAYDLIDTQIEWQQDDHWRYGRHLNETMNSYFEDPDTAPKIRVPPSGYIERGMKISFSELEEFLSNFHIGEEVVLPPSGFSGIMEEARRFSMTYDVRAKKAGVIIRIKPAKGSGEMFGLHLSNASDWAQDELELPEEPEEPDKYAVEEEVKNEIPEPEEDEFEDEDEYQEAYSNWEEEVFQEVETRYDDLVMNWEDELREWEEITERYDSILSGEYDDEGEIVVPGTVSHRVLSVKKHIFPDKGTTIVNGERKNNAGIHYVIELQEVGPVEKGQYVESLKLTAILEASITKRAKKLLKKYVSGRLAQKKRKKK